MELLPTRVDVRPALNLYRAGGRGLNGAGSHPSHAVGRLSCLGVQRYPLKRIRRKIKAGNWSKHTALMVPLSSIFLESVAALCGKATRMGRGFLGTLTRIAHTRRRKGGDWGCVVGITIMRKAGKGPPLNCASPLSRRGRFASPPFCAAAARFSEAKRSRPRVDARGVGGSGGFSG